MESTVAGDVARTTQALADKATDKVQGGIHRAQSTVQQGLGAIDEFLRCGIPKTTLAEALSWSIVVALRWSSVSRAA